jgi:hypothetical protein
MPARSTNYLRLMHPVPLPCRLHHGNDYLLQCECVILEQPLAHHTVSCQQAYQTIATDAPSPTALLAVLPFAV